MKEMIYMKNNMKIMDRSYVKDYVVKAFVNNGAEKEMEDYDIEALIDSVLFDWNDIGDPDADFEALVNWNVEETLSHNTPTITDDGKLSRIKFWESDKYIPYPKDWLDQPSKPNSKYFSLRTEKSGWDEVKYFLDKKSNLKLYGKNLREQLEV
tara:strand:- start:271 stop:729 length:459 start_codon:yes stop_codon:yes gene_type:complete